MKKRPTLKTYQFVDDVFEAEEKAWRDMELNLENAIYTWLNISVSKPSLVLNEKEPTLGPAQACHVWFVQLVIH